MGWLKGAAAGVVSLGLLVAVSFSNVANSAGAESAPLKSRSWPHIGIFGTYDFASVQRGLQVYRQVCAGCHSLNLVAFRNLIDIGFSEDEAKAIAESATIVGDDGEDRPAALFDNFPAPFASDAEAREANNGALPPDLSLIVKAREGHEDYIYSLLTGYEEAPGDIELQEGLNYNPYFSGGQIAMPEPIFADAVEYVDGTEATVEQMAFDVTNFLAWAGEPKLGERRRAGFGVIIFLLILTGLLYAVKRKVWADLH